MKALGIFTLVCVLLSAGLVWWALGSQFSEARSIETVAQQVKSTGANRPTDSPVATPTPSSTPKAQPATLPASYKLDVAFSSQAPLSNWDALHEDACEEASFLMVKHYLAKTSFTKQSIDTEIIDLVHFEEAKNYHTSITLSDLNTIVATKYGIKNGQVVKNITIDDIKREIVAGRPVILGMAGKILANPNFRNGGPPYHMLVVTGYDETGFITNDPGTRLGEDFHYEYAGFDNAIHDWNASDMMLGGRNMLVFK